MSANCFAVAEEYRLVHSVDTDQTTLRKGLTEEECRQLKADFIKSKIIVVQVSDEDPRLGTLVCLPESGS
jgi:hypothetical protein